MGVENEDFIGNPNKVEFTDDELEYDDGYEAADVLWWGDEDDIDDNIDGEALFNYFRDQGEDTWYDENEDDDEGDNDYEIDADDFLSGEESDPMELRMWLLNGVFVPVSSNDTAYGQSSSEESQAPPEGNDIDNNEVVKTSPAIDTNNAAASENDVEGDTGQVSPH